MTNFDVVFIHNTMRFQNLAKPAPSTQVLLLMVLVDLFSLSLGQNCAVPKIVIVKQNDTLTETLDTGQNLKTIKVKNVEGIASIDQKPPDYSSVEFNSIASELTLKVKTPLWRIGQTEKSFIDEEMADCINVKVSLICADGRNKIVTFQIPIVDENTQAPRFNNTSYVLETEPCLMDKCTLIFTKDIVVIDEDRDGKNAEMTITTTNSPVVNVLSSDVHPLDKWYVIDQEHKRIKHSGYQIKVKLEIEIRKANISYAEPLLFDLEAVNAKPQFGGDRPVARTSVAIKFMEFEDRKIAPVFASSVYFMCVADPKKKIQVFPEAIKASIPGKIEDGSEIRYEIRAEGRSRNILQINSSTGILQFSDSFDEDTYKRLISSVIEYEVVAKRTGKGYNYETRESFASLIIYFPEFDKPDINTTTTTVAPTDTSTYATTEEWGNGTNPTTEPDLPTTTESSAPINSTTLPPKQTTLLSNQTIGLPIEPTVPPKQTTVLSTQTTLPSSTTIVHPTLPPPPIRPPDHCTCDCTQFSCQSSREPSLLSGVSFHADPYYCTKYHQCSKKDDDEYHQSTETCPTQTIFCPNMSECMSVDECLKRSGEAGPQPHLKNRMGSEIGFVRQEGFCGNWSCTCFQGIWPGEPGNLCNVTNYMDSIEDPNHCEIFHQCQPLEYPHNHLFIDMPRACPKGLIYCHEIRGCTYPTDTRCHCNKTFKHCDVYEMGRWENFDIFNKTFKPSFTLKYLLSLFD